MFAKNDYIIYGTTGVCKITGIEKKKFNNKNEEENSVQSRIPRHVAEFW